MRRWLTAIAVASGLCAGTVLADPTQYTLQSADGKTFSVKDHLGRVHSFKAKRTCQGIRSGHPVMFERGGPNVTCISAQIRDLVTNASCSVWCTRAASTKLLVKPNTSDGTSRTGKRGAHDATNLFDLTRTRDSAHADGGTGQKQPYPSLVR